MHNFLQDPSSFGVNRRADCLRTVTSQKDQNILICFVSEETHSVKEVKLVLYISVHLSTEIERRCVGKSNVYVIATKNAYGRAH